MPPPDAFRANHRFFIYLYPARVYYLNVEERKEHKGIVDVLGDPKTGHILTRAIIDTIHEPLIILDENLRVIAASKSFYEKFGVDNSDTYGRLFYDLGNGEWNIPALKNLLEEVIPQRTAVVDYEVVHDFISLGKRTMLVNACEIRYEGGKKMLLSIFDVTEKRFNEDELKKLMNQKNILLREMSHRIANSLQMIASLLILKAGSVASEEARLHLEDAHGRIMSIATVQRQLDPTGIDGQIEVSKYLTSLCDSLEKSMIGGRKPITITVSAEQGAVTAEEAVSFGLLTTELVINSLKYAFPEGKGKISVDYTSNEPAWTLTVTDDGVGYSIDANTSGDGLGTSIVASLAHQLGAKLVKKSSSEGTIVSLVYPNPDPRPEKLELRG
jgi:chemotaxis protein methyltransferase CheR